jgi:putative membrane protein
MKGPGPTGAHPGAACYTHPPMAARFLDDAARAAFQEAIEAIERSSSAEVVVALRRQSAGYLLANLILGGAAAFLSLAYMLYATHQFSLLSILIDPFVVGLAVGALVELVPPLKRLLVSASRQRAAVERGAKVAFFDRGVSNTRGRTGVLIYLSWLEGQAVVLADSGVAKAFRDGGEGGKALERKLTAAMAQSGAAVARALGELAEALAAAMPRGQDDVNELPDAVDAQLARRAGRRAP